MEPLLSIIIPVYKVEKYLPQCLESIVRQVEEEKGEVEVLVIDDGSPDASGKLADACAKRHSFVRVIHRKNGGVAAARNTGLDQARGGWLYFVDSDDWIARGAVRTLLQKTGENPDADVILLDAWKNTGDREEAWEHFEQEFFWKDKAKIRSLQRGALYFPSTGYRTKVPLAAPWDKVYRRDFLHQWGLRFRPELKVLDDMVFNVEVFGRASGAAYCKEKVYHYRYVPESITNSYRPDRVSQDEKVWEYLGGYMEGLFREKDWTKEEREAFRQAYYCRIIKSFGICCRLCFFHPQNQAGLGEKLREVKTVLAREPYRSAFESVDTARAEWRLKALIFMARRRLAFGIYLLHRAQRLLQ